MRIAAAGERLVLASQDSGRLLVQEILRVLRVVSDWQTSSVMLKVELILATLRIV